MQHITVFDNTGKWKVLEQKTSAAQVHFYNLIIVPPGDALPHTRHVQHFGHSHFGGYTRHQRLFKTTIFGLALHFYCHVR